MGFSSSHSPTRFYVLTLHLDVRFTLSNHIFFFFFRKNHFHTFTLRPGFRFSLSVRIFDLHSSSRYWVLIFLFNLFFSILIFHGVFILSLSKQVLHSHSPCRCWILKFLFFFFSIGIFHHVLHLLYYHFPSRL